MPFKNPIVSGTALTRNAINSPGYTPGVTGWSINRDGSAEFGNVVIRGGELLITDPDGSYVRIYDENPGSGAVIKLRPADMPGDTVTPANIRTQTVGTTSAALDITGPEIGTGPLSPQISLQVVSGGASQIFIDSNVGEPGEVLIYGDRLFYNNRVTGWNHASDEGINAGVAFSTTSATFVTVTGAPTESFTKANDDTAVRLDHTMTVQADAAGTGWEIGLQINGTDYRTGRMACIAAAVAGQPMLAGGHRLITGIPAGTYTVTPRVRRYTGAGNVIWAATNSYCSFTVAEVIET
jgi:hypothetical protein